MKKALILSLVALLMVGCGGGGGTTTTSSDIPGGDTGGGGGTPTGPVGYITVSFPGPSAPETRVPVASGGLTTIAGLRDHFRIVVKQVAEVVAQDEEGNPYTITTELQRIVVDNTIPGSVQVAVRPGDGYTAEVLTYHQVLPINNMLEYGKSIVFSVVSGQNTAVAMTLTPVSEYITMTAPNDVVSGLTYNVATVKTVPLRPEYFLSQAASTSAWPIPDFVAGYGAGTLRTSGNVTLTAPVVGTAQNLYLQGQFFIDDSLLKDTERKTATPPTWSNWRINCPDPAYTESVESILLLPGTVTIVL